MRNTDQLVSITTSITLVVIPRRWLLGLHALAQLPPNMPKPGPCALDSLAGSCAARSLARSLACGRSCCGCPLRRRSRRRDAGVPGCRGAGRWVGDKGQRVNFPSWAGRLVIPHAGRVLTTPPTRTAPLPFCRRHPFAVNGWLVVQLRPTTFGGC